MSGKRKLISVDESTYKSLKEQGQTGDSFSYVIRSVLEKIKPGSKAIIDQEQGDEVQVSENSNADLHILNDPEISSMIQTVGRVKKVMLRIRKHAATCSCCRDVMNKSQIDLTGTHMVQKGRADQTYPLTNHTETQTQNHNSNLDHLARRPNNRYIV